VVPTSATGTTPLEEVPEKDGVDVLGGIGFQRLLEAFIVSLDVTDDKDLARHSSRISSGTAIAPR